MNFISRSLIYQGIQNHIIGSNYLSSGSKATHNVTKSSSVSQESVVS